MACFPSCISTQEGELENILPCYVLTDAITVNTIVGVWRDFIAKRLSSICRSKAKVLYGHQNEKFIVYQNTDKHIQVLVHRNFVRGEDQDSLKTQPNSISLQPLIRMHIFLKHSRKIWCMALSFIGPQIFKFILTFLIPCNENFKFTFQEPMIINVAYVCNSQFCIPSISTYLLHSWNYGLRVHSKNLYTLACTVHRNCVTPWPWSLFWYKSRKLRIPENRWSYGTSLVVPRL